MNNVLLIIIAITLFPAMFFVAIRKTGAADLWLFFVGLSSIILYFLVWRKNGGKSKEKEKNADLRNYFNDINPDIH